jgi:hypothetical protein
MDGKGRGLQLIKELFGEEILNLLAEVVENQAKFCC